MRRMFQAALVAAALFVQAVPAVAADRPADDARAAANLRVFDAVWRRIDRDYYDRDFNGVDWDAARAEFRPKAGAAADERALYAVVDAMLDRLRDEHAYASSPAVLKRREAPSDQAAHGSGRVDPRPTGRRPAELRDGVWIVGFDEFDRGVARWLSGQLARVPDDAPLVVDLRGNPGGYVSELRRTLFCLVPPGRVIASFRPRRGFSWSLRAPACIEPRRGRLVVLVDRRSHSSAELFAAAVQETGRGEIVGERTGGAVLGSRTHQLPDGGEVSVSIGDARTGAGVRLEGRGVSPDVEAATTAADRRAGRDPALARALEVAAGG